jgi:hypothetical protein
MGPRVACLCILLTAAVLPAPAASGADLSVNAGLLLIGTYAPAGSSGLNPTITYLVGASLPFPVAGPFFVEPMVELFGTYYEWAAADSVAVPSTYDAGAGFFTLGSLVSLHGGLDFPLTAALSLGFLLRFPFAQASDGPASVTGQASAPGYFYGSLRFVYPESRLFFRWKVSDALTLVMNLRAFYPVFHLWDGLGQPFVDQFMLSGGLGFAFRLGAPASAPAPAAK